MDGGGVDSRLRGSDGGEGPSPVRRVDHPARYVHPPVRCVHRPTPLAAYTPPHSLRTPPARCVHAPFVLSLSKENGDAAQDRAGDAAQDTPFESLRANEHRGGWANGRGAGSMRAGMGRKWGQSSDSWRLTIG